MGPINYDDALVTFSSSSLLPRLIYIERKREREREGLAAAAEYV
jgi:hypothetical protein